MSRFKDNPDAFTGRYGQKRLPAAHNWHWDRQGIHAALGFGFGLTLFLHWILPLVLSYLFVNYERSEDENINDFAYVDIAGFLIGFSLSAITTGLIIAFTAIEMGIH